MANLYAYFQTPSIEQGRHQSLNHEYQYVDKLVVTWIVYRNDVCLFCFLVPDLWEDSCHVKLKTKYVNTDECYTYQSYRELSQLEEKVKSKQPNDPLELLAQFVKSSKFKQESLPDQREKPEDVAYLDTQLDSREYEHAKDRSKVLLTPVVRIEVQPGISHESLGVVRKKEKTTHCEVDDHEKKEEDNFAADSPV